MFDSFLLKRPRDADEKQTAQPKSNAHENLPKKKKLETPSKMVRSQSSTSNKSETSESVQKRQSSAGKAEASSSKKPATQPGKSKQSTEISAEPAEKRRRAQNFQAFRNRAGPSAPGSKEIPEGETNCLSGLTFVLSGKINLVSLKSTIKFHLKGVLESLDRDDCKALIERYAGRVTTAISGKTNFLILGREGSDAKENKAKELNIKILSEDDLIEMIRTRPGEKSTETKPKASTKATASKEIPVGKTKGLTKATSSKEAPAAKTNSQIKPSSSIEVRQTMTDTKNSELCERKKLSFDSKIKITISLISGVDKYKPQSIKSLVGQQGDKSAVNKLIVWLRDWYKHHGSSDEKVKAKSSFGFNRNEDPAMFKAALLSGPPGIGSFRSMKRKSLLLC